MESLRSAAPMICLGMTQARFDHWQRAFHEVLEIRVRSGRLRIIQEAAGSVIVAIEQVLFLGLGIAAILGQRMTLGMLVAFFALRARFGAAALGLLSTAQLLLMLRVHAERMEDIVFAEALPLPPSGAINRQLKGAIRAAQLAFDYEGRHALIRDFSCELRPGEIVVITGPSGCGKTTLLKLLSAQLPADAGVIEYDGCDIASWNADALRRQFGVVSQDDALFQGTIAENVCGFDASPELVRMQRVLTMTELWKDIQSMPMRLQTALSDMGSNLSGGQRQRLLLARAIYRRPRILFLDEATSHLDVGTEQRILKRLRSLEITILSVAHRQEVLRHADRVIQINQGRTAIYSPDS
jgi:ATP-binding cassette subfamily B protein RaxB